MPKYIDNIILTTNFSNTHDINHINAPKAGLIDLLTSLLWRTSHNKAHQKGPIINQAGHQKIQITVHIMHHQFHHLDHHSFLVHNMGR